jgi:subtilisin family serine protease
MGQGAEPELQAEAKISAQLLRQIEAGAETEFFVLLHEQADLSRAQTLNTKEEKGRYVYDTLVETAQRTQGPLRQWLTRRGVTYHSFYIVNTLLVSGDLTLATELAARPDVAHIISNPQVRNDLPEPAPDQESRAATPSAIEPGIAYVRAHDVWALGYRGQGIVIGGADTGYAWQHPALKQQYRGWNPDTETANHDYNWHDAIHEDEGQVNRCGTDSPQPCDDLLSTHGTHTMGTAVGWDGGENQIGMAPDAEWIGCRNMESGDGTVARYIECFEFFLAPYPVGGDPMEDGRPDLAPDVTNNSWTCLRPFEGEDCPSETPDILRPAVEAQVAAGIFTVVAAGNQGSACSTVMFPPAIYEASYSIGNLDISTGELNSGSSRGPVTVDGSNRIKPDMAAPGTQIRSTTSLDGYGAEPGYGLSTGTSMAAPHVTGAVALLLSARPDLRGDIDAIKGYLNANAVPIPTDACDSEGIPNNWYGHGRLDILAAVQDATEAPTATYLTTIHATSTAGGAPTGIGIATLLAMTGMLVVRNKRQHNPSSIDAP